LPARSLAQRKLNLVACCQIVIATAAVTHQVALQVQCLLVSRAKLCRLSSLPLANFLKPRVTNLLLNRVARNSLMLVISPVSPVPLISLEHLAVPPALRQAAGRKARLLCQQCRHRLRINLPVNHRARL